MSTYTYLHIFGNTQFYGASTITNYGTLTLHHSTYIWKVINKCNLVYNQTATLFTNIIWIDGNIDILASNTILIDSKDGLTLQNYTSNKPVKVIGNKLYVV